MSIACTCRSNLHRVWSWVCVLFGLNFSFWQNDGGNTVWQVIWYILEKLLIILAFHGWPPPIARYSKTDCLNYAIIHPNISRCNLDCISTLAPLLHALREQWACLMKLSMAGNVEELEKRRLSWLGSFHSFNLYFLAQKTFHYAQYISLLVETLSIWFHCLFINIPNLSGFKPWVYIIVSLLPSVLVG